jgi:carbamate kinase
MYKTALVAVGGNALIRAGEKGTIAEQLANTHRTAASIRRLIELGYGLIVTHGNGPQVGAQLLRSERGADVTYSHTLDVCGAASQGEIGYLLTQSLHNELSTAGLHIPVVCVVTQTIVSADDPAMLHPTKPIGPFYSRADAEEKERTLGWHIVEDASRGYRRVVPSPEPLEIVEFEMIRELVDRGSLVVCTGGGGIPVLSERGSLRGVEAVIDKDRASAVLATQLGVDLFAICTDTDHVDLNYKKPYQSAVRQVTVSELQTYHRAGHFPPGNMGPKVESVLSFLRQGGREAIITSFALLPEAVRGQAGTRIVHDAVSMEEHEETEVFA